jgi:hypothetical protein
MKNVTITLDEKTAAWARKHAAERGISLSRFISDLLQKGMRRARDYERARRLFFSKQPVNLKAPTERYPSRDELHDRARLR